MATKDLKGLRDHLFDTIERLKDKDNPMEVERARAIADVAGVILDSAKVEIGYMRVTGAASESDFISTSERPRSLPPAAPPRAIADGKNEATVSHLAGRVQCLECNEKFPDAKSLGIHKTRVHFGDRSLTGSQLGG